MKPIELVLLMRDRTRDALLAAGQNVDNLTRDYDELIRAIRQSEREMQSSGGAASKAAGGFGSLQSMLMKVGGAAALINFGKEIINVRAEMQSLDKTFEVLLGNKEKADTMLVEIKNIALKSPLSVSDTAKAAQTLLGFNIEAERIISILEQIGNISMGDAGKFNSLTLAFAQMSSTGKLMGQDLMQMINAGFNPLTEISAKTGKSIGDLKKEMEGGAISAEMVADAFRSASTEGGKFAGMMEAQSEGIAGLKASLGSAWADMLNDIGKSQEGLIEKGFKLTTSLVQNYETIGKVIVSLIATYGAYRAAVVTASVVENLRYQATLAQMAGMTKMQAITDILRAKTEALNKTMLANPYVLVATAVVGLGMALWTLSGKMSEAEKAQQRLNESASEMEQGVNSEIRQLNRLKGELEGTKEGSRKYNEIKEKIVKGYGKYKDGLEDEITQVGLLKTTYDELAEAIRKSYGQRQYDKFMKEQEDNLDKTVTDNLTKIQERLIKKLGDESGSKVYAEIRDAVLSGANFETKGFEIIAGLSQETMDKLNKVAGKDGGLFDVTNREVESYIKNIRIAQEQTEYFDKKARSRFGIEDGTAAPPDAGGGDEILEETKNKSYWEKKKKEAQAKLDALGSLKKGTDEWNKYVAEISEAQKEIEKYNTGKEVKDGKTVDKKAREDEQKQADLQTKITNIAAKAAHERRKSELDNQQKLSDIEHDGFDKREKQIALNYEKERLAIDKHAQELIEKQQEAERLQWEHNGKQGVFQPSTTSVSQLPREQKNELIKQESALNKTLAAETERLFKEQLEEYRTFAQKRLDIEKQYNDEIAALRKSGVSEENIEIAEQKKSDALASLDDEFAQKEETFQSFAARIGYMSLDALGKALKEAEKALKESEVTGGKDDKQSAILRATIKRLREEIRLAKAEAEAKSELTDAEKWKKTSDSIKKCKKEIDNIVDSMDFLDESTKSALQAALNIADGAIAMIDGIKTVATMAGKSISAVEKASVILAIIGAAIKIITAIFNMASAAEERHQEALAEVAENKLAFQREYNLLLLEQNLLLEEASTIFGEKQIEKAANALKVYHEAIALFKEELQGSAPVRNGMSVAVKAATGMYKKELDAYAQGIGALNSITIKTGHEKTGLFGWGAGRDIYTSILDVYGKDKLLNPDGTLNIDMTKTIMDTQTMSEENKRLLQSLIDIQEQAEAAQEALRDYLHETFGVLGDDIMDSITASIRDRGVDAWEAFGEAGAKVIENLGQQLAYELFFADKFAKLQDDLAAVYDRTESPEAIARQQMELVGKFYAGIENDMDAAQVFMENWQKKASEYGFDLWQSEGQQSAKAGAFTTMTQEQGTKLEGLFTSVQMHTSNIDSRLVDIGIIMYAVSDTLIRIEENTTYCRRLEDIASDIAVIKRDGLKMK
jgi:tape measure domain-containing protein